MKINNIDYYLPDLKIIDNADLPANVSGLYVETTTDKLILLNKNIETEIEKKCILAEEIGHYKKTVGNIMNGSELTNLKQENIARRWAYNELVPLDSFIDAFTNGIASKTDFAEHLDVTELFLEESISYYNQHFGPYIRYKGYIIYFDPVGVFKISE